MKKLLPAVLLLIPFVVAACGPAAGASGKSPGAASSARVDMNALNFVPNNRSVTIKAGQAVKFSDPAGSGGIHILVVGTNGTFKPTTGAPAVFNTPTGTQINAGDTMNVTFATTGTYPITCTIHPYMEVTITVTP
jgi:plastocyanin